jgi:hypothetical protein
MWSELPEIAFCLEWAWAVLQIAEHLFFLLFLLHAASCHMTALICTILFWQFYQHKLMYMFRLNMALESGAGKL